MRSMHFTQAADDALAQAMLDDSGIIFLVKISNYRGAIFWFALDPNA